MLMTVVAMWKRKRHEINLIKNSFYYIKKYVTAVVCDRRRWKLIAILCVCDCPCSMIAMSHDTRIVKKFPVEHFHDDDDDFMTMNWSQQQQAAVESIKLYEYQ
jgi:hypothetical protein